MSDALRVTPYSCTSYGVMPRRAGYLLLAQDVRVALDYIMGDDDLLISRLLEYRSNLDGNESTENNDS